VAHSGEKQELSPAALGERLYSALFHGEVESLYEQSLEPLARDADAGLRLELMVDPRDPDLAAVQALPWELIRKPGTAEFPALSPQRPIVRYLAVPRAVRSARRPAILRILAVAANPRRPDLDPLDLTRELRNLRTAARATPGVEVVTPKRPTLAALREALLAQECHVLHFMGHGGAVPGQREQALFLETETGGAEPVLGEDLLNKLGGRPTLRLAVLNACESAALPGSSGAGFEPFAGVANTLVMGGLPAVIAMQFPISDEAAIAFSRAFYQHLAAGEPVDAAVAEGRQAVHSDNPTSFEWATPVLFSRTRTGELFPEQDIPPERPRRLGLVLAVSALVLVVSLLGVISFREARALRVRTLIAEGADFFSHDRWQEARERFDAAQKLAPRSAEVLSDLAGAEEKLAEYPAAERHYREAADLRPESAEHLYNLGHFLNGRRRYAEAYEALQKSVVLDPERADTYADLAEAAASRGMLDRARVYLERALRKDHDRAAFHRRLGEVELNAGQPQLAVQRLVEARRYSMGDREKAETAALLIQAYEKLGDAAASCGEIATFRRLDRPGITPWAPTVEAAAVRQGCSPQSE